MTDENAASTSGKRPSARIVVAIVAVAASLAFVGLDLSHGLTWAALAVIVACAFFVVSLVGTDAKRALDRSLARHDHSQEDAELVKYGELVGYVNGRFTVGSAPAVKGRIRLLSKSMAFEVEGLPEDLVLFSECRVEMLGRMSCQIEAFGTHIVVDCPSETRAKLLYTTSKRKAGA